MFLLHHCLVLEKGYINRRIRIFIIVTGLEQGVRMGTEQRSEKLNFKTKFYRSSLHYFCGCPKGAFVVLSLVCFLNSRRPRLSQREGTQVLICWCLILGHYGLFRGLTCEPDILISSNHADSWQKFSINWHFKYPSTSSILIIYINSKVLYGWKTVYSVFPRSWGPYCIGKP